MKFALSHAFFLHQAAIACAGTVEETIGGWGQYSSQLSTTQQSAIDKLADLIVSSFYQQTCPPFRDASVVGHADKDSHGANFEQDVSLARAVTVEKA